MDILSRYDEMISFRNLTAHTRKSYRTYITAFLDYCADSLFKDPLDVSAPEIREFLAFLKLDRDLSDRTINAAISQIRFLYVSVLHAPWDPSQIPMRRFDTFLPFVPSQEETRIFISTISDLKLKAMVSLMYSAGLRVGEVCSLRYDDISRSQMRIHIVHGKNRSDRYAILSSYALDILTQYWFSHGKPTEWLFPCQRDPSRHIYPQYLQKYTRMHEAELGWPHRLTCHSFRHAFGTHLYENGADLLTIKTLLGHKSLASTEIYVHLAVNAKTAPLNPFDVIMGGTDV